MLRLHALESHVAGLRFTGARMRARAMCTHDTGTYGEGRGKATGGGVARDQELLCGSSGVAH